MLNMESTSDIRKVLTGKDGKLYVTVNNKAYFLAEATEFTAQMSVSNQDYQPIGSIMVYAVTTGVSMTLTLTEAVIRDNLMITELVKEVNKGHVPSFEFSGQLFRDGGMGEKVVFRNCIPDGTIDLINLTPGDIIKRSWTFRVNMLPDLEKKFQ